MVYKTGFTTFPRHLLFLLIIAVFTGCSTSSRVSHSVNATLWIQHSAEYRALSYQIYQSAISNLFTAKEDTYWTAAPHHQQADYFNLPPAIILDVDETVLDNSAFQARLIQNETIFNSKDWAAWVDEADAEPIPGAPEFARIANRQGFKVFYITNRDVSLEKATRTNLAKLGYPLDREDDMILSQNEKEDWTSDKATRRDYVAKNYRIVMIVGDDLNDFVSTGDLTLEERRTLAHKHASDWGRKWYMLPNPAYGSWEREIYDLDRSLKNKEIEEIKINQLNTKAD